MRNGSLLYVELHLNRLFSGIASCNFIGFPYTREEVKEIIVKAISLSQVRDGSLRYFASGGSTLLPSSFYLIVDEGIPVKPVEGCKDL